MHARGYLRKSQKTDKPSLKIPHRCYTPRCNINVRDGAITQPRSARRPHVVITSWAAYNNNNTNSNTYNNRLPSRHSAATPTHPIPSPHIHHPPAAGSAPPHTTPLRRHLTAPIPPDAHRTRASPTKPSSIYTYFSSLSIYT